MGTQEETDWVDVANDLLGKCNINLRLKKLSDCDADVFVALYEAVLGEKVPDYIAAPRSQEDDIHNVQSVIDSLALDYLQISLSHITGENIVNGDKESIKNLLEIFDGLLDYLTEQISEDELPKQGEPVGPSYEQAATETIKDLSVELEKLSMASGVPSSVQSGRRSPPCWSADGSESTAELIRLGDSAQTFVAKRQERMNGFHHWADMSSSQLLDYPSQIREQGKSDEPLDPDCTDPARSSSSLLRESPCSAIPLQPPYQTTPHRMDTQSPACMPVQRGGLEGDMPLSTSDNSQSPRPLCNSIPPNGMQFPHHAPEQSGMCASVERGARLGTEKQPAEGSGTRARRVLFRTEPDVCTPALRNRTGDISLEESKEDDELSPSSRQQRRQGRSARTVPSERYSMVQEELDEPLSQRAQKNRLAEQELHHMSERLAHRLQELDTMLKRALGDSVGVSDTREEDKQSHHSDSYMECGRAYKHTGKKAKGVSPAPKSPRTRSLSPSPPRVRRSLEPQLDAAFVKDAQNQMAHIRQQELQELQNQQRLGRLVGKAYEQDLKDTEEKERTEIEKARRQAQEAEREYRETIWKDISGTSKRYHANSTVAQQHKTPKTQHSGHGRGRPRPRKPTPMKVKDSDLLPVVLGEFPHLQLSPHTLSRMWKRQLKQVDCLAAQCDQRNHVKLANQVMEARRRHDLLVGIIRKEQEHNQRLRDFRERIQQQKLAQNKMREQRQQVVRARKYHNDYHVQLRARLARAHTQEERMFRQIFEEGLELQKVQLREQRAYAREQRREHQRRHRDELDSMENYYRDQFSLLAEALAQERHEIQVRKKAQEKVLQKMKRDLRSKMEREIKELQKIIIQNDDDGFFWELELERLQKRVRTASFQYNAGHHA